MKGSASCGKRSWRAILAQCATVLFFSGVCWWLIVTTIKNLEIRGITVGFAFLLRDARFPISDSVLLYSSTDTFAWAFLVGLCNTLYLSVVVVVASTALGVVVAFGRRASHPLANMLATVFVDIFRNCPLIVLLLFTYSAFTNGLPQPVSAQAWDGFYFTNRGIYGPILGWAGGLHWETPRLVGTNINGGWSISPEFAAAFVGLTVYSTALAAEIIRGGLDAVGKGQWEAARALGLSEWAAMKQVIFPQAVRVIAPPMVSQVINIIKNSTLAFAVGYAELNFVTATTIDQTGQALEATSILIAVFLITSFSASWLASWLTNQCTYVER